MVWLRQTEIGWVCDATGLTGLSLGFLSRTLLVSLLGLAGLSSLALATLVLHVLVIDAESLVNLGAQSVLIIKPVLVSIHLAGLSHVYLQANQLGVVHLQKHAGDLSSQLRLLGLDLGVERLTQHLLLLGRRNG